MSVQAELVGPSVSGLEPCGRCSHGSTTSYHSPDVCPLVDVTDGGGTPMVIRDGDLVFCATCSRQDFVVYHPIGSCPSAWTL